MRNGLVWPTYFFPEGHAHAGARPEAYEADRSPGREEHPSSHEVLSNDLCLGRVAWSILEGLG